MSEMENAPELLSLLDEEGAEHQFEVLDALELEEERYMALVPVFDDAEDSLEDDAQLVILKVVVEGDEEFLEPIAHEEEFDKVAALFMERLDDDYEFTD